MMQKRPNKCRRGPQMLSIPHLIIVFIVALVVFGPEKLPELARNLGKIMGEFRRATGDLRSTFEGHLRDLEREADQRRLRNESQIAATAATAQLSPSPASPTPGSVPTTPPHILGAHASAQESPSEAISSPSESSSGNSSVPEAAEAQPPSPLDPEHHPETLTDAGIHPA
jgi:TatA/E family protein of Tat protein translocase